MRLGLCSCLGKVNRDQQTNVEQGRGDMRLEDESHDKGDTDVGSRGVSFL